MASETRKYYAGIGSRETPQNVLEKMTKIAIQLRKDGYILRSGHAQGADWAFEQGAEEQSDIYIPWKNFGQTPYKNDPGRKILGNSVLMSESVLLENFKKLGLKWTPQRPVQLLYGRNYCQIFGKEDEPPVDFVICWCEEVKGEPKGGTAVAVNLAKSHKIPVYNLWKEDYEIRS